jgi:hypothetical protein
MKMQDGFEPAVNSVGSTVALGPAPRFSPKLLASVLGIAGALASAPIGHAAIQVKLHEVNTSVGLKPTSSLNVWKLETDPTVTSSDGTDLSIYIPSEGMLDNSFDPTKFQLALNPFTDNFSLSYTVQGLGAFQVDAFDVQMSGGGYIGVQMDPTNPNNSIITDIGDVSGHETGIVSGIFFTLVPSAVNQALPADQDQLFFQLNLIPINPGPNFDPGMGTVFPDPTSFLKIIPADPTDTTDPPIITYNDPPNGEYINPSSSVPEPLLTSFAFASAAGILALRRPRRMLA